MSKIKFDRYYKDNTPSKIRKIADSILYGFGAIGAIGLISFDELKVLFTESQIRWGVGIVLVIAFLCKFLSNFFKEEESTDNP